MNKINRGLIVSCQALPEEPMYGGNTIQKMAYAAFLGGAVGIRANTVRDINAIHRQLQGELPIIGLIKKQYLESPVYITPTISEAKALISSKCSVIALDATDRLRPKGETLEGLISYLRAHTDKALMADISTFEEAVYAEQLGFDYISTTMRSYTEKTEGISIPDMDFIKELVGTIKKATLVAEGGIHTFEEVENILNIGIEHIIIGGAITRPMEITKKYIKVFNDNSVYNK